MTNAELAILSLIAECPRHGYEIEQVIEERGMREWTEVGFSSIYYLLKKLEQAGLVAARLEEGGSGPARKVYQVTEEGSQTLVLGVGQALSTPYHSYPPLQLGLANLPLLPPVEIVAALRQYHTALARRLAGDQASWQRQPDLPYFVDAMFDYSVTMITAEMQWIEKFIQIVEAQNVQD